MLFTGLTVLTAAAAGLAVRSEYEKKHFVTERYRITSDKIKGGEYNFVFLSDLHNNEFGPGNRALLEAIDAIRPDGVLIGGDMMIAKGGRDLTASLHLAEELASRYPVFYGNGNHEERLNREREVYGDLYDKFTARLKAAGVRYLSDQSEEFGSCIRITGANLDEQFYCHRFTLPKLPAGELERRVGAASRQRFQILLFHSPLFFEDCRRWGADLTLSGHFHGGTIRLPFLGGVMTPQYQFFLPWCAGRFDKDGRTMLVSRGLGTHSINIRLNDRPQLMWLTLSGEKGGSGVNRRRSSGTVMK